MTASTCFTSAPADPQELVGEADISTIKAYIATQTEEQDSHQPVTANFTVVMQAITTSAGMPLRFPVCRLHYQKITRSIKWTCAKY